jgi:predicted secreted protein
MTKLGLNAKFYRNTGTYATPVWTEVTAIRDLTLSDSMSEADVTRRSSGGWRETVATLREASVDFDMVNVQGDTQVSDMRAAYAARSTVEFAILDGGVAVSGTRGLRASCQVTKFELSQELENAQMYSVTIKPAPAANPPSEMVIP